jgi:hypothetical protein
MSLTAEDYIGLGYVESTVKARQAVVSAFARFCYASNRTFFPTNEFVLADYAAYLANNGVKASSIKTYLTAIFAFQQLHGGPHPARDSLRLKVVLKGIKRAQSYTPSSKHPLTPVELLKLKACLDWSSSLHRTFWACLVVGFWSFLRGGNLVQKSAKKFDPAKHLSALNLSRNERGFLISLNRTKTVQFNERRLIIPLLSVPGNALCPEVALEAMWALCPMPESGSLFCFKGDDGRVMPLVHSKLNDSKYRGSSCILCLLTCFLQ